MEKRKTAGSTIVRRLYFLSLIVALVCLAFCTLPWDQPSQVSAAPDIESLWPASNSVSDPAQLTLTSSTNADGSATGTWADANGKWAKTPYESWAFAIADSTGNGTIVSVDLYLKHYQSGWSDDDYLIQVHDGSTWHDVQAYTSGSGPPTGDTTDSWDVASTLDTWSKIDAVQVRIIGNGSAGGEDTVDWFVDTVEIRVDYTPLPPPDISNTPATHGFGNVATSSTTETGLAYFTLTNNSSFAIDVIISATDMTGGVTWTLSDTATPGANTYGLNAGVEGGSYSIVVKKTGPYNALVSGVAGSGGTQKWGLQLLAPTTFSDGAAKSGTVTLTAVQP